MNSQERVDVALELMRLARRHIDEATTNPDPVFERRAHAQAANKLRAAADLLDDHGRLRDD